MSIRKFFRSIIHSAVQRGQVMVLYAFLIPLLFLFVGVGMDLGWYYLNVSRLQNAADAAALAGAIKLTKAENAVLGEYYYALVDGKPSDFEVKDYHAYILDESGGYVQKEVGKTGAEKEARLYANQNLVDLGLEHSNIEERTKVFNEWITVGKLSDVSFEAVLYSKEADYQLERMSKKSANGIKYYTVTLQEKISHLFLGGFDPMDATVVAYVRLRPRENDLNTAVSKLKDEHTIENWQYQDKFHNYQENWNHYRQSVSGSDGQKNIVYKTGDDVRTETVNVEIAIGASSNNTKTSAGQKTSANGNNYYSELEVDSLNIDFNQDFNVSSAVTKDWDIRSPLTVDGAKVTFRGKSGWDETHGYDLRIQGLINFNDAWRNRNLLDTDPSNNLEPDPLWARIESDPMWSKDVRWGNQTSLNSVHQMIITINRDNTEAVTKDEYGNDNLDSDGNVRKVYKYRPLFIVYMGPESNEENSTVRQSQPVILNLNADFNGILYAPNSPVIINGNGHKFKGFVIAKEYRFLKTAADYPATEGYITVTDSYTPSHTIFVKEKDTITQSDLNALITTNEYTSTVDEGGSPSLYEKIEAPKYFIIDAHYVKGVSGYTENSYVTALKKYKKIADADIVQIKIQHGDNVIRSYSVAKTDLLDTNPEPNATLQNAKYAAVDDNGVTKYILKTNLPFVRVYRNSDGNRYPYVPVCDLKVKTTTTTESDYAGVTLADDDHNAYTGGTLTDAQYKIDDAIDMWKVTRTPMQNIYQKLYESNVGSAIVSKVVDENGSKYFMIPSEMNNDAQLVAEYRKVTYNGETLYIKEATTEEYNENGATYYMQLTQSADTTFNPPIIVDNKGDLQTKTLTPAKVFTLKTESENVALKKRMESIFGLASEADLKKYWNEYTRYPNGTADTPNEDTQPREIPNDRGLVNGSGKYVGQSAVHKDEDYRIPVLERVYKKSTFNLSDDSYYSYFNVPELARVNYTYLNVDELNGDPEYNLVEDMFFTTERASWID